jgi:hypothetical protein
MASQRRFLVYGPVYGDQGWLNRAHYEVTTADMRMELKGHNADKLLFLVSPKE